MFKTSKKLRKEIVELKNDVEQLKLKIDWLYTISSSKSAMIRQLLNDNNKLRVTLKAQEKGSKEYRAENID